MPRVDGHAFGAAGWLLRACVALPLLMLAANLLAWLRWGVDLPFLDDWRAYNQGTATSLALGHLLEATNNTISPIGLALDSLAQRWLGGNPIPYQALSMLGVLGGLLWLQWRLLGWALRSPAAQGLAFLLTIFMVQSGSYWGEQNLAYHQALPLLALLGGIGLNFGAFAPRGRWRGVAIFLLGLAAGLSYVSGAVGALVMAMVWWGWALLARRVDGELIARARTGALVLGSAGALTFILQWVATRQAGADHRGQAMPLTWPDEADFWLYAAGKLGRATGQGFSTLTLEVVWVAVLALLLLLAALYALRRGAGFGSSEGPQAARVAVVFLPLLGLVGAYLALVSLGRAGLRPSSLHEAGDVFRFAYGRFHFFWLTLLFPWLAAVAMLALKPLARLGSQPRSTQVAVLAVPLLAILGVAAARGVFDVSAHYRSAAQFRAGELRCLSRQLGSGQAITCPGFDAVDMPDWTRAYLYARAIDASFVRYLPLVAREGFGQQMLRWDRPADFGTAHWRYVQAQADGWYQSEGDAQLLVPLHESPLLSRCRVLGLQLRLLVPAGDVAQVFHRPLGQAGYAEAQSSRKPYAGSAVEPVQLEFSLDGPGGFEPELRIDPVEGAARFKPLELRVTCRLLASP